MSEVVAPVEKKWWESKTLWINLMLAIAAFFPKVKEVVSEDILIQAFAMINIILRLVTKDKIAFS